MVPYENLCALPSGKVWLCPWHRDIKIGWLTILKIWMENIPRAIQISAEMLFFLTATVILEQSVPDYITNCIMPTNSQRSITTVKDVVTKTINHSPTGILQMQEKEEYQASIEGQSQTPCQTRLGPIIQKE